MELREFIREKYIEVAKLIPPKSKVLDVGCNKAQILDFLKNVEYYGVDINKPVIEDLKKKGINVFCLDLNKNNIKIKEKFDYILILDLLEHVVDPAKIIENSKKLLKEKGYIIVSLPNDYHILNKIRFISNRELFQSFNPRGHLHIFPIKSGKKFLENSGLKIEKKINLPSNKPSFIPKKIKNLIANLFPNNFSRNVIYKTIPIKNKQII